MVPAAIWLSWAVLGVVLVCLLYLGIALAAVLRTTEPGQQEYRYRVFHELIEFLRDLCHCGGRR